ncbi:hypothetical protein GUITHDRAFT_120120 [Guillardia theta CCMP2712]|uniref:RWP-RK domain-containing protein n=1 Tax=Guillardia theta (strain CCMP2712) TaxID=905079 RepID=L1IC43_GUITC|nr:hypothetical protein GUITHDRAFT_120120 [Guillardia theta CCMP2712]EKX33672.1 hypothetical protein GUITHDRAFT_120120 [Guillardia theta CCMP2712]|eukprot:XP_005820652.1 hypothetical protein GUITHDRAFT_120120 [Guillardia theta CCMP2712]
MASNSNTSSSPYAPSNLSSSPSSSSSPPPPLPNPILERSCPASVKIVPRRRKFESRNRRPPTLVSADAVRALMHLSQREAAEQLDISLTALKSACKKMGITGWPYTRKEKLAAAKCLQGLDKEPAVESRNEEEEIESDEDIPDMADDGDAGGGDRADRIVGTDGCCWRTTADRVQAQ